MADDAEQLLIAQIRAGDEQAWSHLIARFEGRLLSFVASRVGNRERAEDIVQETFIGFLTSLPNYNPETPIEAFLFSIAAHKLTDALRHSGRRPTIPLAGGSSSGAPDPAGPARRASSLIRSREKRHEESRLIADCLQSLIEQWRSSGEWERLECMELLWVRGWANKTVAARLGIDEQSVANHKSYVIRRLRELIGRRITDEELQDFGLGE